MPGRYSSPQVRRSPASDVSPPQKTRVPAAAVSRKLCGLSATNPPSIVIVDSCRAGRDFRVTSRIARGPRCRPGVPAPRTG